MKYTTTAMTLFAVPLFAVLGLTACNADTTSKQEAVTSESPVSPASSATSTADTTHQTQGVKTQGIWIDVREADEYAQGHLKDAVNITGRDLPSRIAAIAPSKDTTINVYCRSGNRSEQARKILQDMGYTNVINQGGYQDLYDKGYR